MKIISICGTKKSGKTTTAVKLIKFLKAQNYTVAYLKLSPSITLDRKNSDTGRAKQAGADSIIAQDSENTFFSLNKKSDFDEILAKIDADFLIGENLTENFDYKIFCANNEKELDEADLQDIDSVSGVYANCFLKYKSIPVYNANTEIEKIANFINKDNQI